MSGLEWYVAIILGIVVWFLFGLGLTLVKLRVELIHIRLVLESIESKTSGYG